MSRRIAIVGSRDFRNLDQVREFVRSLPLSTVIVSGGARGVDMAAESEARNLGMRVISHRPDYAAYGKRAPLVRNELIVRDCDELVAFWDGKSSGTMHTVMLAGKAGKHGRTVREAASGRGEG